jgi:hypothetical protein
MIRFYTLLCLGFCWVSSLYAQTDTTYWRRSLSAGANVNQSSFSSNWKAGGINSIALGLFLNAKANYLRDRTSWDNSTELQYGLIKNAGQDMRKSLDRIFLDSKVGYKLSGHWNGFLSGNFITQFAPGYIYDTDAAGSDSLISNLMAPAFLTFAIGFEYKPEPWFSLRLSPFAPRFTFLFDDAVGVNQRYGVPVGESIRTEWLAAMLQADLEKDIATNLNLKANYQMYANYQTLALDAIDHRLSATITAKVNRFISVNLTGILLYDLDQDPGVQYSQALGLGILYNVQNFTDPK